MLTVKAAEVRRILDRYMIEIVERYDLCPWARSAREKGEVAVEIVFGQATAEELIAAAKRALALPSTRVAMLVVPELAPSGRELRALRDAVSDAITSPRVGIADFHPHAPLDLETPARLVPFLRRSPDALLQLVPLSLLDSVRGDSPVVDLEEQLAILAGTSEGPRGDFADDIAETNHRRVLVDQAAIIATLDDIAADRLASYARVGINYSGTTPESGTQMVSPDEPISSS
jgi:hypothetical protein